MVWKDYLPDFKGSLSSFYEESVKPTIESKSTEYKALLQENFIRSAKTYKVIMAIALGIFLLLALAFFWKDTDQAIQWKYLLLGLLVGSTSLYIMALKPWEFNEKLLK